MTAVDGPGGTPVDVAGRLRLTAETEPDRPAIVWSEGSLSYGELDARVDRAAGGLQQLGVRPGDRVALILDNTPSFVEAYFAALRVGAAVVPLSTALTPDELRYALRDSGTRVVLVEPAGAPAVEALATELPDLERVVVTGPTGWEALLDADHPATPVEAAGDDLGALVYTSGTTGRPKGAMLTRANLAANQDQSLAGRFKVGPDDSVLLVLPLTHIYALNVGLGACVRAGATMVLVERFDPVAVGATIAAHGVTIVLGAPPMYIAWVETPETVDLSTVRLAVSGAAPLPVPVLERFRDRYGLTIEEGYGLTEAGPSVASNSMADEPRPGTVGCPLPGVELRLVDGAGRDVPPGDEGEVWVRGPNVFAGYWNDPQATADALTVDGWLRTGDIGILDEDGYLRLVDRKNDLIIVSGFNVYPREVERVLETHPSVAACAVVGAAHPYTGERVVAYVVPRAGSSVDPVELAAHCRRSLARYKCPDTIATADALPTTSSGKVRRIALRDADAGPSRD